MSKKTLVTAAALVGVTVLAVAIVKYYSDES